MPKLVKYPRLKTHVRKGAGGQRWVYYYYDMRPEGKANIPLGKDYAYALEQWEELHHHKPRAKGRLQEATTRWREQELPKYENSETRRNYGRQLTKVEAVLGLMVWEDITLPIMREYLERGESKIQGNRQLSVLSIVWGHARMWGMTKLPWPAAGVKNWKNPEPPRDFEVTDALFDAVYAQADQVLRDCMDIATATGMRITDVRTVRVPVAGILHFKASKTGKAASFEVDSSVVLSAMVERRRAVQADHLMLLTTPKGRPVSARMLRERYDTAREAAAKLAEKAESKDMADLIRAMFLRDMRKRASELASSMSEASELLQHSSQAVTKKHYRKTVSKLRAVR